MTTATEFRFRKAGFTDIYYAVRQGPLWHVTLEGNTAPWMYWDLSDEQLKDFWGTRLTD